MTTLTLIRGLPGSGKSTLARKLQSEGVFDLHLEADQFLYEDGTYVWLPHKLKTAHEMCFVATESALWQGLNVVVSDTLTVWRDTRDYCLLAKKHAAELCIIECSGNFGSLHDVPEERMQMMRERYMKEKLFRQFYADIVGPIENVTYIHYDHNT